MGINLMAFSYWPYKVSAFFQILSLALFDTSSIFPCSKPIKFRDQVRDLWHLSQHAILELLLDFLVLTCIYMSAGGGTHTDIHQKNFIWMWAYMQIFHVYQIPKSLLVISRSHFIHLKVYKYNKYICMIHIYIYACKGSPSAGVWTLPPSPLACSDSWVASNRRSVERTTSASAWPEWETHG